MPFDNLLKQKANVMELQAITDANGGIGETWALTHQDVACLVQPWGGGVFREEERDGSMATHRILLKGSFSLSGKNQIHVDALKYNVLKSRDWNSLGHHTTAECALETS